MQARTVHLEMFWLNFKIWKSEYLWQTAERKIFTASFLIFLKHTPATPKIPIEVPPFGRWFKNDSQSVLYLSDFYERNGWSVTCENCWWLCDLNLVNEILGKFHKSQSLLDVDITSAVNGWGKFLFHDKIFNDRLNDDVGFRRSYFSIRRWQRRLHEFINLRCILPKLPLCDTL